jgi:DNA-directed RNA polymerase specialized sigma24 family protein
VFDPRLRRVVELRFFAGLSVVEVASRMHRGVSTVRRDCALAKAWLRRALK